MYCANAGVARGGLADAPERAWETSWQVNVMAHVRAAKVLVPQWLARGRGTFVATVSAAGLLSIPGAAPYAVTKHAAYAFAEWMSMTYGDARGARARGVPAGRAHRRCSRTPATAGRALMEASAIEPDDVAAALLRAMDEEQFLVLPHPEVGPMYAARAARTRTGGWPACAG